MTTQQKHQQKLVATYFKNKQMRKLIVPYIVLAMATMVFFLLLRKHPNSLFINPDLAFFLFCYGAVMFIVSCLIIGSSLMILLEKISGEGLQMYYEKNEKAAEKYIQTFRSLKNTLEKEDDEEQQLRLKRRILQIQKKLWKLEFECKLIYPDQDSLVMMKINILSEQ